VCDMVYEAQIQTRKGARRKRKMYERIEGPENRALVLEAFDTLFNKRDYSSAERSCRRITSSTALMSSRAERDSSPWSRAFRRLCNMSLVSLWPTETS
jgi:hypothetical protein